VLQNHTLVAQVVQMVMNLTGLLFDKNEVADDDKYNEALTQVCLHYVGPLEQRIVTPEHREHQCAVYSNHSAHNVDSQSRTVCCLKGCGIR